ncbi:MAG: hypothetical protein FWD71_16400 [Oscillospiraceae bacterium]|nr:hypothetical protein [Oscillospiraceae bacterium]
MKARISVAPVKKYAPPKYPTLTAANREPALLRKLPSRWQKNAAVVAAVGMLGVISLSSCGILSSKVKGYNPNSENFLNVAPVFIHGAGTGSMGCMMIAPPVFLSEEEALAVIKNETENSGLDFSAELPEYIASSNKKTYEKKYSWERYPENERLGDGSVGLDLYDGKNGIALAYISMDEAQITTDTYSGISLDAILDGTEVVPMGWNSYPRELAELTADDFSQQRGDIDVGVFYDPGIDWTNEEQKQIFDDYLSKSNEIFKTYVNEEAGNIEDENRDEFTEKMDEINAEYETDMKLYIEEQLRAQVRDFIEWLQGQGII